MTATAMEALCAEVCGALSAAGVDTLVLKGPAIAAWLYADGTPRTYRDVDVLVDLQQAHRAADVLLDLGFSPPAPAYLDDTPGHAHAWHRYADGRWIDLHYTLTGVGVPPERLWSVLWPRREPLEVAGAKVAVLDEPARALHLALHLAQDHLGQGQKRRDLARALDQLTEETWVAAHRLAVELDAAPAMGAGLRQLPAGATLAERLHLPPPDRLQLAVRAGSSPVGTKALAWLVSRPGVGAKLRYAAGKAFPPPWFLRSWTPVASRFGPAGLALGYLHRLVWLARITPPAARAWLRARRQLREAAGGTEAHGG